ncbi:hypothetical protein SH449x_003481 [Pirellulaceae bacterium SH449]
MTGLSERQLVTLTSMIRTGMMDASKAMSTWLERAISVEVEPLRQLSLSCATQQLGADEETVYVCWMRVIGEIQGQLLLGFDNQNGLLLCNFLLNQPAPSESWGELETSAVMETTNIVGCAFLNSLHRFLAPMESENSPAQEQNSTYCIPSPPVFLCDYAEAIMQSVLADQAGVLDAAIVAKTELWISQMTSPWHFMFIPDTATMERLARLL